MELALREINDLLGGGCTDHRLLWYFVNLFGKTKVSPLNSPESTQKF